VTKRRAPSNTVPHCIHDQPWNTCAMCKRYAWCVKCLALIVLDAPARGDETITCSSCVDASIAPPRDLADSES